MTTKKPSEIGELVYEAQEPIDETSDLVETDSNNFLVFLQTKDQLIKEILERPNPKCTDRDLHIAIAKDAVKMYIHMSIAAAVGLFTGLATSYLLLGSDNLNNQSYDVYIPLKEKAAICDTVIAPLQESMRNSCNQENFERGTALKVISDKKNQVLEQYACTPQEWQCKPSKPYDLDNSTYTVEFRYK